MSAFNAFRVFDDGGTVQGRVVETTLDGLSAGDVVINAAYSSVNYKDALAATGAGSIMRRFPIVAGIDVAGTVESSADARFQAGDQVLVTGYDLGVAHDGGYAGRVRVPADWVVPVPPGLTTFDAMAIGTAGFTAALSVVQLEHNGLQPSNGPVIVTGATGGVGSLGVQCLVARGYQVAAMTGKESEHEYLRSLGASTVLPRSGSATVDASPPQGNVGRRHRSRRWGDARLADAQHDVWRRDRRVGPHRRRRPPHHGDPIHPSRRQAAGDRLGDVSDGSPARRLASPGDRPEAGEAEGVGEGDRAERSA